MKENNDISGTNIGDLEGPREFHAGDTKSAQTTAAPDSKKFEMMLAITASLALVVFLLALWKILG